VSNLFMWIFCPSVLPSVYPSHSFWTTQDIKVRSFATYHGPFGDDHWPLLNMVKISRTLKGLKGPLILNYGNLETPSFYNLSGTPPRGTPFNITNIGRTVYDQKEPLMRNYRNFKNLPFTTYCWTPPTCKLFYIMNIGRALRGPKGPLIWNCGNFEIVLY